LSKTNRAVRLKDRFTKSVLNFPMKNLLRLLTLLLIGCVALRAADHTTLAAVRAADDARIAATKAADRAGLEAAYSDELHYAHSSGKVDRKASQIEGVVNGGNIYEAIEYPERTFVPVAPGIVLMKGRALFHMKAKADGSRLVNDLNFLAVWRNENGKWRFLAWQSCKNPPAAATAAKK
jgi:hypothetical protein